MTLPEQSDTDNPTRPIRVLCMGCGGRSYPGADRWTATRRSGVTCWFCPTCAKKEGLQ
jgi:hypothetical protein